ncbi:MAG TPA: AAA domain-containing protein, partial [Ignavibacteria bacterium]|nr:AAA domain-containing protein [Ignavibacteria bacterium]
FQRNYVLDLLNEKADRNSIFAEKLNILKNKPGEPFFVKNLENIQGDERDIIIISTTFGRRADGSFLQNFGPINQEKGFRLLNVIITRAKHMMIVCSSIPDEYIAEYPLMLETSGNRGKGIFYAFLAYAKSIESGDVKSKELLLNLLGKSFEEHSQES